ncbi:hypothetical protein BO82DRAFT_185100 [Aspergillus uvarum CBS 121591]|uniref:Uncharacterized protein n=1 Tax=Aspergillus uvarum CBS 121591 TaxID=1448315 RepID=A0A319CIA3_9EURO|nr:hypothetical protein BO82DRAFT_185100 [Aspergillus uvarum CBS 121591]PYH85466.1 hypothetical protein BO82DRAFT_185100 [Aspergillus uvarum CBS 121591]
MSNVAYCGGLTVRCSTCCNTMEVVQYLSEPNPNLNQPDLKQVASLHTYSLHVYNQSQPNRISHKSNPPTIPEHAPLRACVERKSRTTGEPPTTSHLPEQTQPKTTRTVHRAISSRCPSSTYPAGHPVLTPSQTQPPNNAHHLPLAPLSHQLDGPMIPSVLRSRGPLYPYSKCQAGAWTTDHADPHWLAPGWLQGLQSLEESLF